jgi:hypothetical protein
MQVPVLIVPDKLGEGIDDVDVPPSADLQSSTEWQSTTPNKELVDVRRTDTKTGRRKAREMNDVWVFT